MAAIKFPAGNQAYVILYCVMLYYIILYCILCYNTSSIILYYIIF